MYSVAVVVKRQKPVIIHRLTVSVRTPLFSLPFTCSVYTVHARSLRSSKTHDTPSRPLPALPYGDS